MAIDLKDLKKSIEGLGYYYPKEIIKVYGHKELKIQSAGDYVKNNFLKLINKGAYNYLHIEALIEYIIITTIGLTDVFAIIMYKIFNLQPSNREKIYFNDTLCNKLLKETNYIPNEIANKIKNIRNSKYYQYLKDLCNYIKHNDVIDTSISIKYNREIGGNFDIIIKEFTFNNNKYPSKSFNELYNDYIKISNDLIEIFKIFINNHK